MAKKQSKPKVSALASKALRGGNLNKTQVKSLAGSVLSQDETKGQKSRGKR